MADSSLQDRLREHEKSFDGLLSLIPAKLYYGEDTSDQWKKKKQTKEEAAAAQRAKLDPSSVKTAKDVMEERARKRRLEEIDDSDVGDIEKEQPKQGLKDSPSKNKKQKTSDKSSSVHNDTTAVGVEAVSNEEKRRLKQQQNKDKRAKKAEKRKEKEAEASSRNTKSSSSKSNGEVTADLAIQNGQLSGRNDGSAVDETKIDVEGASEEVEKIDIDGLGEKEDDGGSVSAKSSAPASPLFDNPVQPSASTSTSSIVPPATAPKHIKLPTDPELLKARLNARIDALRAARKADGPDGAPARNRQELMEARRKKEEQRRAHKKELRIKAKLEEDRKREEALASARGSPASSMMSPSVHSADNNFAFGRIAFANGQRISDDLSRVLEVPKRKGPQDPATALQASEKKSQRVAGFDETKKADIEEKDLWLNAKKKVNGERIRDDVSLLKKTLKRKEKAKKKSEMEWAERKDGVAKGQARRVKKREDNLRKRKEEKGSKGKGKSGGAKGKKSKPKSRPGFEGSFTSKRR